MSQFPLNPQLFSEDAEQEPIRKGFGRGLLKAGQLSEKIVALVPT